MLSTFVKEFDWCMFGLLGCYSKSTFEENYKFLTPPPPPPIPPPSFSFVQFPFVRTTNNLYMKIKGDCSADEHVPSAKNSDFSLCTLYLYILKAIRTIL